MGPFISVFNSGLLHEHHCPCELKFPSQEDELEGFCLLAGAGFALCPRPSYDTINWSWSSELQGNTQLIFLSDTDMDLLLPP